MSEVIERLIRYCKVATPSDPANEAQVPSNPEEFDLANLLRDELLALGVADASVDEHAYVMGHIPASQGCENLPCLGFNAHIDASPDAPAHDIHPQILTYEGGELVLGEVDGKHVVLNPENTPDLPSFKGKELLVSDGSTLLAVDDKAGVAEIMQLVATLVANPELPHPPIAVCFSPDEEIGHGCALLDLQKFGATYGYTLDGDLIGGVDYECFNATSAEVHVSGLEIHPGSAKDVMVNAIHVLEEFDSMLPAWQRPEHTDGYDGFFHLMTFQGTCVAADASYIIRDHSADLLEQKKQLMLDIADLLNKRWPEPRVTVKLRDQYRNMAEMVKPHMQLVDNAYAAFETCGVKAFSTPMRGGTDGAQLSFRGLPCPNLSTGGGNYHSVREFAVVEQVEKMVDFLVELVRLYTL